MLSPNSYRPLAVVVVAAAFAVASAPPAAAESREAKIARAMTAAPAFISADATVVDGDGTVLREGSNGWVCLPGDEAGTAYPMCNDEVWMAVLGALGKKEKPQIDRIGISYMLAGDANVNNDDPFDTEQDPGEVWVQEGPHLMLAVPDSRLLEGLPSDPNAGGPYVMWKGTPYAHVMVPTAPRE